MKIAFTDQEAALPRLLEALRSTPLSYRDESVFREQTTTIRVPLLTVPKSLDELDLGFFRDYRIFPGNVLRYLGDWRGEGRPMRVGDTIVQQACLPPRAAPAVKLIMGVRVLEVVNRADRTSFRYGTLVGHVERGTSDFIVTLGADGLTFTIHTFSEPAVPLNKLAAPLFARPYQRWVTRTALRNLAEQLVRANPGRARQTAS